jgi:hypothetical protein
MQASTEREISQFFKGKGKVKSVPVKVIQNRVSCHENYLSNLLASGPFALELEFPKDFNPAGINGLFLSSNKLDNTGVFLYTN